MECGAFHLGVRRLSADGIAVPKDVGMTPRIVFYGLYFILFGLYFIVFIKCICWSE